MAAVILRAGAKALRELGPLPSREEGFKDVRARVRTTE
jgi:hypothetical protein